MNPSNYMYTHGSYRGSNNMPMNTGFIGDPPASITRTMEMYKNMQDQDPQALGRLVQDLIAGIKVPLPCPNDPVPCSPPHGGFQTQTQNFSIIDQLKSCVGKWAIFFYGPTVFGPFIMQAVFIVSLLQDAAGNVLEMEYLLPGNTFPSWIRIDTLVNRNLLKALQC